VSPQDRNRFERIVHQALLGILGGFLIAAGLYMLLTPVGDQWIAVGLITGGLLPIKPAREGLVEGITSLVELFERVKP
jgi:hypothetical protein